MQVKSTQATGLLTDAYCEGIAMYILLWPEDGRMKKSEVLGVFDGTTFEKIAQKRASER